MKGGLWEPFLLSCHGQKLRGWGPSSSTPAVCGVFPPTHNGASVHAWDHTTKEVSAHKLKKE